MTLGEKLRQAREQKGFTLSEVAEQTRISPLYLESIENDDYSILPGGIFNKGFVKSYAKFVGINEQEALQDYTNFISQNEEGQAGDEPKTYRPQVLTDEGRGRSMLPTAIAAIVILALMTGGILLLLNYRNTGDTAVVTPAPKPTPTAANEVPVDQNKTPEPVDTTGVPDMATLKVEFKTTEPVSLSSTSDGTKSTKVVTPSAAELFEPKENLKLSYSRSLAQYVQLTINGKQITPPATPLDPKRSVIEFEINKDTLPAIWKNGAIVAPQGETPVATPEANLSAPSTSTTTTTTPKPTPPRTANSANTAGNSAAKPPAANIKPASTPRGTVITIPSANRPANRPPR